MPRVGRVFAEADVDVVQNLDVVADEADRVRSRRRARPRRRTDRGTIPPSARATCPPVMPWLWKAKSYESRPTRAATAAAVARHSRSYGSPLASAFSGRLCAVNSTLRRQQRAQALGEGSISSGSS